VHVGSTNGREAHLNYGVAMTGAGTVDDLPIYDTQKTRPRS